MLPHSSLRFALAYLASLNTVNTPHSCTTRSAFPCGATWNAVHKSGASQRAAQTRLARSTQQARSTSRPKTPPTMRRRRRLPDLDGRTMASLRNGPRLYTVKTYAASTTAATRISADFRLPYQSRHCRLLPKIGNALTDGEVGIRLIPVSPPLSMRHTS